MVFFKHKYISVRKGIHSTEMNANDISPLSAIDISLLFNSYNLRKDNFILHGLFHASIATGLRSLLYNPLALASILLNGIL